MKKEESLWHSRTKAEVLGALDTSENGITDKEAQSRLERYGRNILKEKKHANALEIFLRQFKSLIIYILILAAVISFFVGEPVEFIAIVIIVVFISALGFMQEYRAERAMQALERLTSKKAKIRREGVVMTIDATEVVPGDIIILEQGDHVPADARLISANNLAMDESALTGESLPVMKSVCCLKANTLLADLKNMVFTGTFATDGDAEAIVVQTGMATEIGKIAALLQEVEVSKSPIQQKLDLLSRKIAVVIMLLCIAMMTIGIIQGQAFLTLLMTVAVVAVSGIPESLPAAVTITLAKGIQKMAKENAVVKTMPAVETLGSASIICTDKTGTLTENKMTIEAIFTDNRHFDVTGDGYEPKGSILFEGKKVHVKSNATLTRLIEIGVLCNNSSLIRKSKEWDIDGDPTEGSLIVLGEKAGMPKDSLEKRFHRTREFPFDSKRKCMSTINRMGSAQISNVKGAPEMIIRNCKSILIAGEVKNLDNGHKEQLIKTSHSIAQKGLRILALAYKDIASRDPAPDEAEENLTFVGLVGMRDPPKQGVNKALDICRKAGIKVVMITGDHEVTARTIATELGIFEPHHRTMTGEELSKLNETHFEHLVEHVTVYARLDPEQKIRIVSALQKRGHVVAMTGDGVNDAPALKKADIGVAMGKRGTDVAREAADMILRDDHFATLVNAVKEGRTIFANIKRFVYYLLTGNFAEVIVVFVALLLGAELPLTAMMILFINLVTSELPAFGLSTEPSRPHIMEQRPKDTKETILGEYTLLKIAELVPIIVFGTILMFVWELAIRGGSMARARTLAFATIIFFELFHVYNAKADERTVFERQIFSNRYINLAFIASVIATAITMYTRIGQKIFHTAPLMAGDWIAVVFMAFTIIVLLEIQKTIINAEIKERESLRIAR